MKKKYIYIYIIYNNLFIWYIISNKYRFYFLYLYIYIIFFIIILIIKFEYIIFWIIKKYIWNNSFYKKNIRKKIYYLYI